jgi:ADP-heptose:LPS heptosyltransferase
LVVSTSAFKNIFVIDLGQLGDVVLSLPALHAIREKFASAKITVLVSKPAAELVRQCSVVDDVVTVDRRKLKDGPKLRSILDLFHLAGDVRRRHFDLVIDLHSFYETNILGFLSGAQQRLFANRENRSLDFLANFQALPPREDKTMHHADRYLAVLRPLGIENVSRTMALTPAESDRARVQSLFPKEGVTKKLAGLFLGAGHATRRWSLQKFADLAERLSRNDGMQVVAFMGPEERALRAEANAMFSGKAALVEELGLSAFFAALSFLDVLVCGDTGPMRLAALAGTAIVLLAEKPAPTVFLPLTNNVTVLVEKTLDEIEVSDVEDAVLKLTNNNSDKHEQPE